MSTARQTVAVDFFNDGTFTGRAGVASVNTRPLEPTTSPAWWWGVAPGALLTPGNTAAPATNLSPAAPAPGTPPASGSSDGCC
ncbi:MAG: hypothetical protein ACRDGQ_09685 [Candidatus Limnocylindrales bacterium]